jgi:hypothetical protein
MTAADRQGSGGNGDDVIGSSALARTDVQRALAAGFSPDDVVYMLALPCPDRAEEDDRRSTRS